MKYVKLFEHWLLEAEAGEKPYNEVTLGDLRAMIDINSPDADTSKANEFIEDFF